MKTFAHIISPCSIVEFFETSWTQQALHIPGSSEKFSALFSWEELNDLLADGTLPYPRVRLVKDKTLMPPHTFTRTIPGEAENFIDPEKVNRHLKDGATLIFDGIYNAHKNIKNLVNLIQFELGEYTHVNLYSSAPNSQGFELHYDSHEVFLLQISGQKQWKVFEPGRKYPLQYDKSGKSFPLKENYLDCTLSQGDVLYIPRGHWHAGVATKEPSLHLTLAVNCRTGISFLHWLIDDLRDSELWRQNLPLALAGDNNIDKNIADMGVWTEKLKESLIEVVNRKDLAERYIDYCIGNERSPSPYNLPTTYTSHNLQINGDTRFFRSNVQKAFLKKYDNPQRVKVTVWGKHLMFNGNVYIWVDRLFSSNNFTGNEAASWQENLTWTDIQPILELLTRENIISIETL